jgi:two-component system response regulator TctD
VILDLMLPEVPGVEVLRRARPAGLDAHVLVLSAKDQVQDRVGALELGADALAPTAATPAWASPWSGP